MSRTTIVFLMALVALISGALNSYHIGRLRISSVDRLEQPKVLGVLNTIDRLNERHKWSFGKNYRIGMDNPHRLDRCDRCGMARMVRLENPSMITFSPERIIDELTPEEALKLECRRYDGVELMKLNLNWIPM